MSDNWIPEFYLDNPLFTDIASLASNFKEFSQWPDLDDYNQFISNIYQNILNENQIKLRFVSQGSKPECYEDGYEPRIYLKGEIQTRLQNWHDFFQIMIWARYPHLKSFINALHYKAIYEKHQSDTISSQRGAVENTLTLFDECGAIIVSSNTKLLKLISNFSWEELFIKHRTAFRNELDCYIFGHALYEKALSPYIGMTAHAILIEVDAGFFTQDSISKKKILEEKSIDYFKKSSTINTRLLHPFPILGVPGWDKRNESTDFYKDENYFRPGKRKA